jgi:hypothetical protein
MGQLDEEATDDSSPPDAGVSKRCTKCGVDKPLAAYNKQPGGRTGCTLAVGSAVERRSGRATA